MVRHVALCSNLKGDALGLCILRGCPPYQSASSESAHEKPLNKSDAMIDVLRSFLVLAALADCRC